jgi:hypothetical protein
MTLSDEIVFRIKTTKCEDELVVPLPKIKQFIKELKEVFDNYKKNLWGEKEIRDEIDKLAGDKLI